MLRKKRIQDVVVSAERKLESIGIVVSISIVYPTIHVVYTRGWSDAYIFTPLCTPRCCTLQLHKTTRTLQDWQNEVYAVSQYYCITVLSTRR